MGLKRLFLKMNYNDLLVQPTYFSMGFSVEIVIIYVLYISTNLFIQHSETFLSHLTTEKKNVTRSDFSRHLDVNNVYKNKDELSIRAVS